MTEYTVRQGFVVFVGNNVYTGGDRVELTDELYRLYKGRLEGSGRAGSIKKTEKAKSQDEELVSDTPQNTVSERTRQQQLITTDKICRTAGIKFDKPDLPKIARYGVECVTEAIEMFKERSLTSVIKNPEGWVRRCLQCGWYKNWQKSLVPKKPIEEFIKLRDYLLENLGTLPA